MFESGEVIHLVLHLSIIIMANAVTCDDVNVTVIF